MSSSFPRRTVLRWTSAALLPAIPWKAFGQEKFGQEKAKPGAAAEDFQKRLGDGIALLDKLYWCPPLNIWLDRSGDDLREFYEGRRNPPWWSSANAVELLIDFMNATGGKSHDAALEAMHATHRTNKDHIPDVIAELRKRGQWSARDEARQKAKPRVHRSTHDGYNEFCNEYLDDSGWWGIAWLKMHQRTKAEKYLTTVRAVHGHMAKYWGVVPPGGVIWNVEHKDKVANTISNLLFLILSARLYRTTGEKIYLEWAERTYAWVHEVKLYDGNGFVDVPGHKDDHWTYNQGTWAGGLLELYLATGDQSRLDEAASFLTGLLDRANATTADGVIIEKLSAKGWDTALFKGVFANYLGQFLRVLNERKLHPELAERLRKILQISATSMIANSIGPDGQYAMQWQAGAKEQEWNYNTHLSGLMLLTAQLPIASGSAK